VTGRIAAAHTEKLGGGWWVTHRSAMPRPEQRQVAEKL